MSLLKTVGPGESSGEMEKVYQSFIESVGMVPPPFIMYSTSPRIQELQAQVIAYYREHSNLSPLLMALIRYLTALALEMEPCVEFNVKALAALGLTHEQIDNIGISPAAAPIEEKDGWLLAAVIKAVGAPETVSEGHMQKLREMGWTDSDIFDAFYISCMMAGMGRMMKVLKIE